MNSVALIDGETGTHEIVEADCSMVECEYCGELVDPDAAASMSIPSATLYLCSCGRWTEDTR